MAESNTNKLNVLFLLHKTPPVDFFFFNVLAEPQRTYFRQFINLSYSATTDARMIKVLL